MVIPWFQSTANVVSFIIQLCLLLLLGATLGYTFLKVSRRKPALILGFSLMGGVLISFILYLTYAFIAAVLGLTLVSLFTFMSNIGDLRKFLANPFKTQSVKEVKTVQRITDKKSLFQEVQNAVVGLSDRKVGALITFEKNTNLNDICKNGVAVNAPFTKKIIQLISNGGEQKTKADEFIAKFARIYTPLVVGLALVTFLIGGLITQEWETWVHTGLEILVIGCPCAIVISVPLAFFSAIGLASKNGIVIKGANYLDKLLEMGVLITDKTGTLTHGSFEINKIEAVNNNKDELLEYLYAAECLSKHPIGKAICHNVKTTNLASKVTNFNEIAGLGIVAEFEGKNIIAGGEKLLKQEGVEMTPVVETGTIVYCAVDKKYVGYVSLSDVIKDNAQPMVNLLHSKGIDIVLLTGDKEDNAKQICNKLGIDRWYSELLHCSFQLPGASI